MLINAVSPRCVKISNGINQLSVKRRTIVLNTRPKEENSSFDKHGLLGRAVLFSALICSLQAASAADSFAEDSAAEPAVFIGSGEGSSTGKTSGCDYDSSKDGAPDAGSYDQIYGGKSENDSSAKASGNTITLGSGHKLNDYGELYGGYAAGTEGSAETAEASNNSVQLLDGVEIVDAASIWGGCARGINSAAVSESSVQLEKVTISGSNAGTSIMGGQSMIEYGDNSEGSVSKSSIQLKDVTFSGENAGNCLAGGYTLTAKGSAAVSENSVLFNNVAFSGKSSVNYVYGGYAFASIGSASADNNSIELNKAVFGENTINKVRGGYAKANQGSAAASGNNVQLSGVTFKSTNSSIWGGDTIADGYDYDDYTKPEIGNADTEKTGSAASSNNTLTLSDTEISGTVYGGSARVLLSGKAVTSGNTAALYGGTYSGAVYAGYSSVQSGTAESTGNTVSLWTYNNAGPDLEKAVVWGGRALVNGEDTGTVSGGRLEFHQVQDLKAVNIKNFAALAYELPDMKAGATVLTLSGSYTDYTEYNGYDDDESGGIMPDSAAAANVQSVEESAGSGSGAAASDAVENEKTDLSGAAIDVQWIGKLTGSDGGEFGLNDRINLLYNPNGIVFDGETTTVKTVNYQKGISLEYPMAVEHDEKSVYLTRAGEPRVLSGTKAIAEGAAAGLALVNEAANAGIELARTFDPQPGAVTPFVYAQGSSVRHETGSHIDLNAVSLMAGVSSGIETGAGRLSAGVFFEYGKGSYTTSNSFSDRPDVNGDGNAWYMGGGILAKMEFLATGPGHFYVEGSAHMGQMHNEYDTSDLRNKYGRAAGFDLDSPYYALHGGLGYVWNITDTQDLDVYGKYIWTRIQGTDETLTTSDEFEFDDMDSSRMRFGARYTYKGSERFKPYIGAAWEHEFAGSCESTAYGFNVAAPSFEGDTGIGELGITMTPSESLPLSINLGVQGYVGQKRGVSGNCMVKYEF